MFHIQIEEVNQGKMSMKVISVIELTEAISSTSSLMNSSSMNTAQYLKVQHHTP